MRTLKEIVVGLRTDKEQPHGYLDIYEEKFGLCREDVKNVLEIGIATGDSLLMWAEYFPNAIIHGFDIQDVDVEHERVKTYICDQTNEEDMRIKGETITDLYGKFDIIIDDGGHTMEMHQKSLKVLFPFVSCEGMYVIEDLHTCYGNHKELYGYEVIKEGDTPTIDVLKWLQSPTEAENDYSTNYIDVQAMKTLWWKTRWLWIGKGHKSEIAFICKDEN